MTPVTAHLAAFAALAFLAVLVAGLASKHSLRQTGLADHRSERLGDDYVGDPVICDGHELHVAAGNASVSTVASRVLPDFFESVRLNNFDELAKG